MHLFALAILLLAQSIVAAQEKPPASGQPAQVATAIATTFDSIQPTKNGLAVSVSYINRLSDPVQITLNYPLERSAYAIDNLGNEYTLTKSTAMQRVHSDPNLDVTKPSATADHSTYLLALPQQKVSASFLFERTTKQEDHTEKPTSYTITIGHYVRPARRFVPRRDLKYTFSFTATISHAKPTQQ